MTISEALEQLGSDYRWRVTAASDFLARSGSEAVPPLCKLLRDGPLPGRWRAAAVLGQIGDTTATAALELAMSDGHALVRQRAAEALLALRRTDVLVRIAAAGPVEARRRAVLTLWKVPEPPAVRALARAIQDRDLVVRCQAAAGLAHLARTALLPALRLALPPLVDRAEYWLTGHAERRAMKAAAKAIETATHSLRDLPLPASLNGSADALPIPARPPRAGADLPQVPGRQE